MKRIVSVFALAMLFSASAAIAAESKKAKREAPKDPDWPTSKEVEKAIERARYDKDNTAVEKPGKGHEYRFIPADLSHTDKAQLRKGAIIGQLESDIET